MREGIYLTQTDTTVGFLSQNPLFLAKAKKRDSSQPFLICVDSFDKLKKITRAPKKFKKMIRRSKKSTFIYPDKKAVRVVGDKTHSRFLKKFDFLYSSSANENRCSFNLEYALAHSDIIVEDKNGFYENDASSIYKIGKSKISKLR